MPDVVNAPQLPLSLCVSLYLALPPQSITPTDYSLSLACSAESHKVVCGSWSRFRKMRKESRLVRWISWTVVVTALFLLGFIVGKSRQHSRNTNWTWMLVDNSRGTDPLHACFSLVQMEMRDQLCINVRVDPTRGLRLGFRVKISHSR